MNNAERILRAKSDLAILEGAQPVTPEIESRIAGLRSMIDELGEPPALPVIAPGLLSRLWSKAFGKK